MKQRNGFTHPRCLSRERSDSPALPEDGDEIYSNGVIKFHITALLEWLKHNPQPVVDMSVQFWGPFRNKEECYVNAADLTRPIVIAEVAPDYRDFLPEIPESDWLVRGYVCIDGQHRIEKARRMGLKIIPAVVLRMEQHAPFIYAGYDHYVEYWNAKLRDRTLDAQRRS